MYKYYFKLLAVFLIIFLGLIQGISYLRQSSLLVLARSTASSPLSLAFYKSNGVEFWALKHFVTITTDQNEIVSKELSSGDVNKTGHPYFIKMIYAYPFAFSHELPEELWRRSLEYGICKDPLMKKIINFKGNMKKIKIEIKHTNPNIKVPISLIEHTCGQVENLK